LNLRGHISTLSREFGTALLATALLPLCVCAQVTSYGDKQTGENSGNELPSVLKGAKVDQHLNRELPLSASFTDETGKAVTLGTYFGPQSKKPAVVALVYYECKMLCSEELDGLVQSLAMVKLDPGKDFDVIIASIDPNDSVADAAKKKAIYTRRYGRSGTENGWHFLTTTNQDSINALTSAIGFGYVKVPGPDGVLNQYAHASSIELVTPEGKVAQYYMGVEYSPKDMLLGLIESSGNKIGSPVANILTYCYHYDPERNKHSLIVARVVQFGGMITVASLGSFMFLMFRKDAKLGREHALTKDHDDKA